MGDLRDWSPEQSGAVLEERPSAAPSLSINLTEIGAEYFRKAEEATEGIIAQVQPTAVSERRRKAVIDYVQRLIRGCLGCEVFPFGSVPLKTYLPDGDIDLTAFGGQNVEEALANDVFSVLEREDQNGASEFVVKDVQLIRAEVKLVKCLVQNIIVDISFNQLGGLCTLCFLEKVDRLIGKDHLFKRSIILIKAWCYYESRILGAHHGLISTYALETLVLYIFHLFHSSLNGPLAVLYKFLDYFSKFDWENYCISLNGPVHISSLPEIVAAKHENGGGNLLLSNDFIKDCIEMFSVPSRGFESNSRAFPPKHLNIVDPLKENNNLGRSVSKGNFYRIRSAFTYGARKLGHILSQPEENITDELRKFFSSTLDRHGSGQRPDVQDPIPLPGHNGFELEPSYQEMESCQEDWTNYESECADSSGLSGERVEMKLSRSTNEQRSHYMRAVPSIMLSEPDHSAKGDDVSEYRISGDAEELATLRIKGLTISNHARKSPPPSGEESVSPSRNTPYAPHLYFSRSFVGNGEMRNGNSDRKRPENLGSIPNTLSSVLLQAPAEITAYTVVPGDQDQFASKHEVQSHTGSENGPFPSSVACLEEFYNHHQERASAGTAGSPQAVNTLSDLCGDYESHQSSLQYGQWCYDNAMNAPTSPISQPLPSQFQKKSSWDAIRRSVQFRQNVFPQMNANGVLPMPSFYPVNPPLIPGASFGMEEIQKPRGTGTYFPNLSHYKDRPFTPRGRPQASARSPRNNVSGVTPKTNLADRSSRDLAITQFPVHQGAGRSGFSDIHCSSPRRKSYPNVNGSMLPSERFVEFRSISVSPSEASLLESTGQPSPGSPLAQNSGAGLWAQGMQKPNPAPGRDQDRVAVQSYRLKDEDDFPPLSV